MSALRRLVLRRSTPRGTAVALFIVVYAAVGAAPPYLPVYYESLGLSLDVIGLLAAVAALSGLIAAPAWGVLADQLTGPRPVLAAAALGSAACAAGMAFADEPVAVTLMAVLYALMFAGIGPVLDAFALDQVLDNQHRYARLRVWGSISFVASSVSVGVLVGQTSIRGLFIVLVGSLLLTAGLALLVPARSAASVQRRLTGLRTVLRNRALMAFIGAVMIAWSASAMVNGFLSIYLVSLDASPALVGVAWALGAVVEVPLMIAFPMLAGRFGLNALLVAGVLLLLLRVVVLLLNSDPLVVTGSMALHGAGFAFLLVGGVTYVAAHAPAGSAATAQGVLSGVVFGLAQAVGPAVAGGIAGAVGLAGMFVFAGVGSAVAVAAVAVALRAGRDMARSAMGDEGVLTSAGPESGEVWRVDPE